MAKKPSPTFDPDGPAAADTLFGLPYTVEEAKVVVLPVPWDVTVSYQSGAAKGPEAILNASVQVDLFDEKVPEAWKIGIAMESMPAKWIKKSKKLRPKAEYYIDKFTAHKADNKKSQEILKEINTECGDLMKWVKEKSLSHLKKNKIVALIGGDHSTPLGLMQAVSEHVGSFGILHIDAHCDLRNAYEGFTYSHASIMYNALKIKNLERLVQVGIRDYSEGENKIIQNSKGKVKLFSDKGLKENIFHGASWHEITQRIISTLPKHVYISFDIDGLDPKLCPNTGTPVPGGLQFWEAIYLIEMVVESGRQIIAFDINEVAPGKDEWDANVGARLLYKMSNLAAISNSAKN
ncbi:MAG: agmatinase family protein [Bacteroidia bacterium]